MSSHLPSTFLTFLPPSTTLNPPFPHRWFLPQNTPYRVSCCPVMLFPCTHHSFPVLNCRCKEDSDSLLTKSHMGRTGSNQESFPLNTRQTFFTVRTIIHCNNLPRDVAGSPRLEVFKVRLDRVLDNLI